MIERTRDVALVNRLVARDFEGADFSEVLAEPLHVCLVDGESAAIFMWRGPGIYEVHLAFAVRGREALGLCAEMLAEMRRSYGAEMFWALIPIESRKVRMFARLMGWKSRGVKETRDGPQELFASGGVTYQGATSPLSLRYSEGVAEPLPLPFQNSRQPA